MISPLVDELVGRHPNVAFAKFDTNSETLEAFAAELGVKALPAFRFYKVGWCSQCHIELLDNNLGISLHILA
jgi:hypothetical protein